MTYWDMNSYLKGLHITLESWRQFSDKEGWHIREKILSFIADSSKGRSKIKGIFGGYNKTYREDNLPTAASQGKDTGR